MTHRGPFQPLMFCDSVILCQQVCGIYTQKFLLIPRFLHALLLLCCFLGNGGKPSEGRVSLDVQIFSSVSTLVQENEQALNGVSPSAS